MKPRDLADLLLLGALWGASFLFMRIAAPEFGAAALVWVRVAGAAALLLLLLTWRRQWQALHRHGRAIAGLGVLNSALPFLLFGLAAQSLSAGLMAVFNATAPIWATLIAWVFWRERPDAARWWGLLIGLAGVVGLAWGKLDFRPNALGISPAMGVAACLAATVLYGWAANLSRRQLAGVSPLALAGGTQLSAAVVMSLPAWWTWPATSPTPLAWGAALTLAVACTGLAYLLYFRLIAHAGAQNALSVTLLIPAFAMGWGWLVLGERPTLAMVLGCAAILAGTALSTGLLRPRPPAAASPDGPPVAGTRPPGAGEGP